MVIVVDSNASVRELVLAMALVAAVVLVVQVVVHQAVVPVI